MEDYNFWADFWATYRASPDAIKALWVLVPPGFALGLVAVLRLTRRRPAGPDEGAVAYTSLRDGEGLVLVRRHDAEPEAPPMRRIGQGGEPIAR